jgi:broad specificity phosphatase PhoE
MRRRSFICLFGLMALSTRSVFATNNIPLTELARPGRVLMLRHAFAPGTGDPPGFRLSDCATQRNLDESGRAQARELGERLAAAGVGRATVYSSQWCRCLETARLLQLGEVTALPALNSFFSRPQDRQARVTALRAFLAELPVAGEPVVLVTHQVTINAFTDAVVPSGGGSIFQLNGSVSPRWLGSIPAPWSEQGRPA